MGFYADSISFDPFPVQDNELMQSHMREHIVKYFPEEEPVVLEEIVLPEEEVVELDGNTSLM